MRAVTASTPGRPEALEVRRRRGGRWVWSWIEESGRRLESHESYGSASEARASAREAYPDLEAPPLPREHRLLRRLGHAVATTVKGAALLGMRLVLRARARSAPERPLCDAEAEQREAG